MYMYVCMYVCMCECMYVCVYVCMCMSTFSNIFSSETTGPIEAKFHNRASLGWGNKNLLNGAGHMTKMAAMSIYGKNLKQNHLPQNSKVDDLETWYAALGARVLSQDCSNDDPGLTLTYFTAMSNLVPYAFVWEKCKTMDFSETIVVCDHKVNSW